MSNYEFMAMTKKLSDSDDQKNLITGLVITTIVIGGYAYLQYRAMQAQSREVLWLKNGITQLKEHNKRQVKLNQELSNKVVEQQAEITDLRRSYHELAGKVKNNQGQDTEA